MSVSKKTGARVALVTGAGRRIGRAIVLRLHALDFNVAIHCHRSVTEATDLAHELNGLRRTSACVFRADLMQTASLPLLIDEVAAWHGRLDVLVNNASVFIRSSNLTHDEGVWDALWSTNVKAPQVLSAASFPWLSQHQGVIVNLTDIHADRPLQDYGVYCQTKAALTLQTKDFAREFAPNVRVNAVAPGAMMWPEGDNQLSRQQRRSIIEKTPLRRHGDPQWIAHAVQFCVDNEFMTGQVIRVDGGRSLSASK